MEVKNRARRRRGATRGRSDNDQSAVSEAEFSPITRPYPATDILSDEQVAHVHAMSLRLLSEVGLQFLSSKTWPILEQAGCNVDREAGQVRFPSEVVEEFLAKAPKTFTLHARNESHSLIMGGDHIHFGSASSAPNVLDMDNGRRPGTQQDFEALVKLN